MESTKRLFNTLVPNLPNCSQVIKEKILYGFAGSRKPVERVFGKTFQELDPDVLNQIGMCKKKYQTFLNKFPSSLDQYDIIKDQIQGEKVKNKLLFGSADVKDPHEQLFKTVLTNLPDRTNIAKNKILFGSANTKATLERIYGSLPLQSILNRKFSDVTRFRLNELGKTLQIPPNAVTKEKNKLLDKSEYYRNSLERIFGPMVKTLDPKFRNLNNLELIKDTQAMANIIRDRQIFSTLQEKVLPDSMKNEGDNMDVDLGHFIQKNVL